MQRSSTLRSSVVGRQEGIALIVTLMVMMLVSVLMVGFVTAIMADQRATSPIHAKMTEHPMFNLVPFAGTWGEMADGHAQANVSGQLLQGYLPQAVPATIAAPAVGRNQ